MITPFRVLAVYQVYHKKAITALGLFLFFSGKINGYFPPFEIRSIERVYRFLGQGCGDFDKRVIVEDFYGPKLRMAYIEGGGKQFCQVFREYASVFPDTYK